VNGGISPEVGTVDINSFSKKVGRSEEVAPCAGDVEGGAASDVAQGGVCTVGGESVDYVVVAGGGGEHEGGAEVVIAGVDVYDIWLWAGLGLLVRIGIGIGIGMGLEKEGDDLLAAGGGCVVQGLFSFGVNEAGVGAVGEEEREEGGVV